MAALAAAFLLAPLWGQVTGGSISGFVFDPSGRPVPHAEVTVSGRQQAITRKADTDAAGYYRVPELPARDYSVVAVAPGLAASPEEHVQLPVDTAVRVDFHLSLSGRRELVTVKADIQGLPTESSDLGQVLDRSRIESLPLNERDFLQLAMLAPGVAPPVEGSQLSSRGSFSMSVNGGREEFNNFLLDGVDNNDRYLNGYNLQPPVDAIQEFKIAVNSYSAEYGRSAAGQINVVTRSGTNEWHGFGYDYLRNRVLDARNFFDADKPKYIRNQFGSGLGGPIRKNRTFFFADFDMLRERAGQSQLSSVPNSDERAGDLSGTGVIAIDPFSGSPFPGSQIPASRISPVAERILDLYPLPNLPGSSGNYLGQQVLRDSNTQFDVRLDHQITGADQLTLRYNYGDWNLFEPFASGGTTVPGFGDFAAQTGHNAMIEEVHTFGPRAVNSLLLGFNLAIRSALPQNHNTDVNSLWGVDYLPAKAIDYGYPSISIAGYSGVGDGTALPLSRSLATYQLTDTLALTRGAHNLKIGAEFRNIRQNGILDELVRGSLSFSGALTGSGIADLLLGLPTFGLQAQVDNPQHQRTTEYNAFVQDDWKISRNLTLNLGVRYEFDSPPTDPRDRMTALDPMTNQLVQVGTNGVSRSGIRPDRNNVAPRAGFAWQVAPKTVIRGGYGIYYDAGMLEENSSLYFNPPYFNVRVFFPTASSLLTLDNPFPTGGAVVPPASITTLDPNLTTAYVQDWNWNIQREVWGGGLLSVAYAGSKGTHLIRAWNRNQPAPGAGDLAARVPYPEFGNIEWIESGADSTYHSLQVSYRRSLSRSLSILGAYTYSKSIDDTSAFLATTADVNFPQNSSDYRAERALSSFDTRHRASVAWVCTLPGHSLWLRNFELSSILVAESGHPFTPRLEFDNSNTGNTGPPFGSDRPNVVSNPSLASPSANEWFNTSAFAVPAAYTFGNAGRNILTGPGLFTFDLSLARQFTLTERARLIFEVQAYNLLNRTNFDLPQPYADQPSTFGHIFSAEPPRQIQMALRLRF